MRLALGYSAFAVAALCFLWDYKLGWDSTKHFTAAAVVLYMILNGALTLWMSQKEKNVIYQGTAPGGEEVCLLSALFLIHIYEGRDLSRYSLLEADITGCV